MPNNALPGNPRYQPKALIDIFGYDNLFRALAEVEIATMHTLGEIGVIPEEHIALLTHDVRNQLLAISTTEVDRIENEITKHDVRAWVRIAQGILPPELRSWVHVPLTSYDALDTARTLQFVRAHTKVIQPLVRDFITQLTHKVEQFAGTPQIGRTHGQHALPITVGFWLATILGRVLVNIEHMDALAASLCGKISGAVGAYNAQVGLGFAARCGENSFEKRVLIKLGLKPAAISTQILPPEGISYYLFAATMLSGALAQFACDARHLMRTEIGEVCEPFEEGQVGSSTMAHKRNPKGLENTQGMFIKNLSEFMGVLLSQISEHQRDLVGSPVVRDFPTILVNLVQQLSTFLRPDKGGKSFLKRMGVDVEACNRNLATQANVILAEPAYIALQMAGYMGDAHEVINSRAISICQRDGVPLMVALGQLADEDKALQEALDKIPGMTRALLSDPLSYTGDAKAKALEVTKMAARYLGQFVAA